MLYNNTSKIEPVSRICRLSSMYPALFVRGDTNEHNQNNEKIAKSNITDWVSNKYKPNSVLFC